MPTYSLRHYFALPLFFLLSSLAADAQPLSVSGQVVEQNSQTFKGKRSFLGKVDLQISGKSAKTDGSGAFSLKINPQNAPAYVHAELPYFQVINQDEIENELSCTESATVVLPIEMGRVQSITANFSRFFQQLNALYGQTQVRWFRLFYDQQVDSLARLMGDGVVSSDLSRGFLRELFQDLEPQMEYWAHRLALVNLDHRSSSYIDCYQKLRSGQIQALGPAMDRLARTKDIRITAVKDLLMSWYIATGQLNTALEILVKNMDQAPVPGRTYREYYRLGMLLKAYDDIIGVDDSLLAAACDPGSRFLSLVDLTGLYAERLDFGKATYSFEQAEELWQDKLKKHAGRYEPEFARLLVIMGVLLYQQSDMEKAKTLVDQAIGIYERLSLERPLQYEIELMRSKAVLATFYVVYSNQYRKALEVLEPTLLLGQRLSRQTPQLYLPEVADMYFWEGSCHQQLQQYEQAIRVYELATRYYEQLALKNPLKLETVCSGYFLIAEAYNQQYNRSKDAALKEKGMEAVQAGLQKVKVWKRYDPVGAEMMEENLRYYEDVFKN